MHLNIDHSSQTQFTNSVHTFYIHTKHANPGEKLRSRQLLLLWLLPLDAAEIKLVEHHLRLALFALCLVLEVVCVCVCVCVCQRPKNR